MEEQTTLSFRLGKQSIRFVEHASTVGFFAVDIAKFLGIANIRPFISKLPTTWKASGKHKGRSVALMSLSAVYAALEKDKSPDLQNYVRKTFSNRILSFSDPQPSREDKRPSKKSKTEPLPKGKESVKMFKELSQADENGDLRGIIISNFNHKGGVAKTTSTYSLGWEAHLKGLRTLLVDTDSQCNLSQMVLQARLEQHDLTFEDFFANGINSAPNPALPISPNNIADALRPLIAEEPRLMSVPNLFTVEENLFLLCGHPDISDFESLLGDAYLSQGSRQRNCIGAIFWIISELIKLHKIDIVFLDLSPSIQVLNRNLIMMSDFFVVPCAPDYFSFEATRSLQRVVNKWKGLDDILATNLRNYNQNPATYPHRYNTPRFLGAIVSRYRLYNKKPAKNFLKWINKISVQIDGVSKGLVSPNPVMVKYNDVSIQLPGLMQSLRLSTPSMALDESDYARCVATTDEEQVPSLMSSLHLLGVVSELNQLMPLTHYYGRPVNGLKKDELTVEEESGKLNKMTGDALKNNWEKVNYFKNVFEIILGNIISVGCLPLLKERIKNRDETPGEDDDLEFDL